MKLKIPKSKYVNYYEVARYELTWNLTLILVIFLPILSVILFTVKRAVALPTLLGIFVCLAALLLLKSSGKYKVTAVAYSITGLVLNQFTLLSFPNALHFADPIWMVITVLFTYFTLGKIWGSAILFLNIIGTSIFILFFFNENMVMIKGVKVENLVALTINFAICSIIVAFLIFQFLKLNKYAEEKYVSLTESLRNNNNEKTVLLKEVHHRVKNNLQVIISLMRLKAMNEDGEGSYSDTIDRIRSMSLIHEKMYQAPDLSKIDLKNYIESLARDLISSYSIETNIKLEIKSNLKSLETKSLVPIALIFNELISNSIKHGFKNQENGLIRIQIDDNYPFVKMSYSDTGIWIEKTNNNSLGLELIQSLTEQLTGQFKRNVENGTHYKFEFTYDS